LTGPKYPGGKAFNPNAFTLPPLLRPGAFQESISLALPLVREICGAIPSVDLAPPNGTLPFYSGTIDVLVTDIIMPRVRGLELAKRISRFRPAVAVVFMSGYSEEALVEGGLLAEANVTLIQKPFDPEVLVTRMRQLLDVAKSR
jgi:CheY-like chemotaxis protein